MYRLLSRLDSEPEYQSSPNAVLRLIRKMVVNDHYISRAGAGRLVDVLPNLESLDHDCGSYYIIPAVEEKSLNLKTSIERSIPHNPWRYLMAIAAMAPVVLYRPSSVV